MPMSAEATRRPAVGGGLRFHPDRNKLLAEAHARPSTPLPTPTLATRIATMPDDGNLERDWEHMVALCRRLDAAEPSPGARWCVLDAGTWWLRWERHTEASTWTFYRPIAEDYAPGLNESAIDLVPQDWLAAMPGSVLAAAHIALLRARPAARQFAEVEEIAAEVSDGVQVFTDFRPGPDGFTRFLMIQPKAEAALAGRVMLRLFEIETYRLMALLAFPLTGEATVILNRLEAEAGEAARQVREEGGIEADRGLLNRLAALAAEAQALAGRTNYRFAAARAYHGLVMERIEQLRERRIEGRPNITAFMERRLAPAMRTCAAVAERQQAVIDQIARTSQLLNTRVELATEVTNANLLASMDRRARQQLRLQQTVEGLSVAAISYYSVGLLNYLFKALEETVPALNPTVATGIAAPVVFLGVWWLLARIRKRMLAEESAPPGGRK
ncbi:MAG: DUF3422 domain-containing protein [Rhodospirillaceae bacterium]|nr:DUF3422 domain-containing protein [Rhodospirillaceae bacterium]